MKLHNPTDICEHRRCGMPHKGHVCPKGTQAYSNVELHFNYSLTNREFAILYNRVLSRFEFQVGHSNIGAPGPCVTQISLTWVFKTVVCTNEWIFACKILTCT